MKTSNLLVGIALFASVFWAPLFAQKAVSYKGVSITRGEHSPNHGCDWTNNCVYVKNDNQYDAIIRFDYKLDSREAPWQTCSDIKAYKDCLNKAPGSHMPSQYSYSKLQCFPGEIKGLRITYVDILKPSAGAEIMKALFGDGSEGGN